jgi:hypothetical protein
MTTIKTILFATIVAAGLAACHEGRDTHTPAQNTYGTSGDNSGAATPTTSLNTPDVNGTGNTGAAGVNSGTETGAQPNAATTPDQSTANPNSSTSNATGTGMNAEGSYNNNPSTPENTGLDNTGNQNANRNPSQNQNPNQNTNSSKSYPSSTDTGLGSDNMTGSDDSSGSNSIPSGANSSSPSPTPTVQP